eukprot:5131607-Pleurochrysis_carterae.AAC.2
MKPHGRKQGRHAQLMVLAQRATSTQSGRISEESGPVHVGRSKAARYFRHKADNRQKCVASKVRTQLMVAVQDAQHFAQQIAALASEGCV